VGFESGVVGKGVGGGGGGGGGEAGVSRNTTIWIIQ